MSDTITDTPPAGAIATAPQILLATFLGGPLAGYYLAAQNHEIFDHQERIRPTLMTGLIATLIVAGAGALLPFTLLHFGVAVGVAFFVYNSIGNSQRRDINRHLSSSGECRSFGYILLVALVGALINASAFTALFLLVGIAQAQFFPA